VLRLDVLAVGVVEEIERLGHQRIGEQELSAPGQLPLDRGVPDGADAVGPGDQDRALEVA
jgi:hypothetical protein